MDLKNVVLAIGGSCMLNATWAALLDSKLFPANIADVMLHKLHEYLEEGEMLVC